MWIKKKRSKTTDCYLGPFYQNIRFAGKGDNACYPSFYFTHFLPLTLTVCLVYLSCSSGSAARPARLKAERVRENRRKRRTLAIPQTQSKNVRKTVKRREHKAFNHLPCLPWLARLTLLPHLARLARLSTERERKKKKRPEATSRYLGPFRLIATYS